MKNTHINATLIFAAVVVFAVTAFGQAPTPSPSPIPYRQVTGENMLKEVSLREAEYQQGRYETTLDFIARTSTDEYLAKNRFEIVMKCETNYSADRESLSLVYPSGIFVVPVKMPVVGPYGTTTSRVLIYRSSLFPAIKLSPSEAQKRERTLKVRLRVTVYGFDWTISTQPEIYVHVDEAELFDTADGTVIARWSYAPRSGAEPIMSQKP